MIHTKKYYNELLKKDKDYKKMSISTIQSFLFGGFVCLFGQVLLDIYAMWFEKNDAVLLMVLTIVLISGLLSGIGVYDLIGQVAKCGLSIPITGFSNSCVSSAMEYKKEGFFSGLAMNCLKLAGSVIVLGTISGLIVGFIKYIIEVLM